MALPSAQMFLFTSTLEIQASDFPWILTIEIIEITPILTMPAEKGAYTEILHI